MKVANFRWGEMKGDGWRKWRGEAARRGSPNESYLGHVYSVETAFFYCRHIPTPQIRWQALSMDKSKTAAYIQVGSLVFERKKVAL